MRAIVQRVSAAGVTVQDQAVSKIGNGLLVLVGIGNGDDKADVEWMARKLAGLRIFDDGNGKMNRNVQDVGGSILLVSQFTLFGDVRRGNRPSFDSAEEPQAAQVLFNQLCETLRNAGIAVKTGIFRTQMSVSSVNEGPVSILIDSKKVF